MARDELVQLLECINNCCESMEGLPSSNPVKLMLYFDEPHVLAGRRVPNDPDGRIHMIPVLMLQFLSVLTDIRHLSFDQLQYKPAGSLGTTSQIRSSAR